MGLHGNPWRCLGNDGAPHRNLCESAWEKFSHRVTRKTVTYEIKFHAQEPTRDMVAYKGNHIGLYRMKFSLQNPTRETVWGDVG